VTDAVKFHDQLAASWEQGYQSENFAARLGVLERLLAPFDLRGQHWLDAGCGTGTLSRWLAAAKECHVTGVDASESMLANAAPCANVRYQPGALLSLDFDAGTFDGAICSSVLEYVDDPLQALRELRRVLKQNGILLISLPRRSFRQRFFLRAFYWLTRPLGKKRLFTYLDHSKHAFTEAEFSALLARAGFSPRQNVAFGTVKVELSGRRTVQSSDPPLMMFLARAI
jgi:ubiquinone/menaquinone biosynthesis C-methylase UbiE